MPRKPDLTGEKKRPRVSVLERRLQNPFGEPSAPVRLKDPTLHPRWFNASSRPDNIWRAKELGLEPMVRHIGEQGSDKSSKTTRWI